MLIFQEEVEKLMSMIKDDLDEVYHFLNPLLSPGPAPIEGTSGRDIVLYAAGKTCDRIYHYLMSKGIKISAVCDKNKRGEFLDSGLEIISPQQLYQSYKHAWIVVCTFNYSVDAITELCLNNIPEKNILRATFTSNLAYFGKDEFYKNAQLYNGYKFAYERASDDISKSVVLDVLRKDMTGSHVLTKTSTLPGELEYFDFEFGEKEVFVQAGCYIGDTVEAFIQFRNNNVHDTIYTFECDDENYEISKKNLQQYSNVHMCKVGLWDKEEMHYFMSENNARSRMVDWAMGDETAIKVTTLDHFFEDKSELPTFIQLDIEGSEPQALLGAKDIIRKAKPKLAICVYHHQDHIYSIPKIIQDINPDYKRFRFVQAFDSLCDTILFVD